MYQATITSQRQMSIPAKLMSLVGLKPGEKVNLSVSGADGAKMIVLKPASDWESLRGVLKKYTKVRRYPTQNEIAAAWAAGYKEKWLKNEKNSR